MSVTAKIENKIKKITLYIITSEKRTLINGKEQMQINFICSCLMI